MKRCTKSKKQQPLFLLQGERLLLYLFYSKTIDYKMKMENVSFLQSINMLKTGLSTTVFLKRTVPPVSEYISNGKLFYMMANLKNRVAVWSDGYLCIELNGPPDEDTLKKIIDSTGG